MSGTAIYPFPFTAIVGQENFKTALLLSLIDPSMGGVLAVGDRGAGKTTLIRSLTQLMAIGGETSPFVNLPIGASEDRLLGHVNLEKLINEKQEHVRQGLLARAHGGILYVDEINLLNDYLMDTLLDASASGYYYLEREGLSRRFDSRFLLIGSMNPEEGDLRPQLLDRFGFCVEVKASLSKEERVQIIENRMSFDANPEVFTKAHQQDINRLQQQVAQAKVDLNKVAIRKDNLMDSVSIALEHRVEGIRADVLLIKAARAWAALQGRQKMEKEDLDKVAPLVLQHRSRRKPPEKQSTPPETQTSEESKPNKATNKPEYPDINAILPETSLPLAKMGHTSKRGKDDLPDMGTFRKVDYKTTEKSIDIRKTVHQYISTDKFEIQKKYTSSKTSPKLIFLIDSSGSMMKDRAIAYAKGLIRKTLEKARKTEFALVAIHHSKAELLQPFTANATAIIQTMEDMPIGGKTNIIAAIAPIKPLLKPQEYSNTQLIILTDGRFNVGSSTDVLEESIALCRKNWQHYGHLTVVDSEQGVVKLGLAKTFATGIGAAYQPLKAMPYVE